VDVTTEEVFFRIERSDFPALIAGNQFVDDRATETVQIETDPVPILLFQSDFNGPHRSGVRADDAVLFHAMAPSFQWFEARSPCVARNPILGRVSRVALSDNPTQRVLAEAIDLARRQPQLAFAVWQSFHVRETLFDQVGDAPQRRCLGASLLPFPRHGHNLAAFRVARRDFSSASHFWTCFQARRPAAAFRFHQNAVLQSHTPILAFKLRAHRET
jgi:hypothetical protein